MKQISLENNDFLNIEVTGSLDLPKIIFSNSLGSDLRMWDLQVEVMKDQFCIIRYDKRGHGKSSPAEGPYSFDMLENDVIKIMDDLEIEKANFVGLSMGGMTSLGLALKYQNRFDKFVCCAARADMPPPLRDGWDQRIAVVKQNDTDGVVEGSLERWYSEEFTKDPANLDVISLSRDMITNTSKEGYIGSCEAIKKLDYLKDLSTINKEILYISGEKDMGAPAMAMEEMHHLTPNSCYECISGAAHILNIECAEKVNKTILDFLN
ncbi:alpha/beta fold hydrolase [Alphaproteobacteria bacterium]|nr:alpha/beta fold hydrolase [Alphaproteobacteria bacterium]MDC1066921.1 alpha/beta fold hydrolase [Alphaproteobacteria bacterium]